MSLISTYQGRKSLFAEKLITKGVDASGSEGLTTLINKIGSIQHFSDGVLLFGDKNIIQTSQSMYLSAMAVENGKLVNDNIEIYYYGDFYQNNNEILLNENTVTCDFPVNLGTDTIVFSCKCKANTNNNVAFRGNITYLNGGSTYETSMFITSSGIDFFETSGSLPSGLDIHNWIDLRVEYTNVQQKVYINGVLVQTLSKDFTDSYLIEDDLYFKFWSNNSNEQYYVKDVFIGVDKTTVATGSHGFCSGTYTGSGVGRQNFYAVCRSLQSGTLSVWDVIKYDDATINSHDDTLWQSLTYLSRGEEYSTFTSSSSQTLYTSVSSDVTIEFDVNLVCANSSPFISLRKNNDLLTAVTKQDLSITNDNWYHIKISIVNSVATVTNTTNDVTISNLTVTDVNRFYFRNGSSEQVMFKNFKVYNS